MAFLTQIQSARKGIMTPEMKKVAEVEFLEPEFIMKKVALGHIVIPANKNHKNLVPMGIGRALRTKVNANIGNSPTSSGIEEELEKLSQAIKYGSDTVMDLSTGERINEIREAMIENSPVPIGTVPIYHVLNQVEDPMDITEEMLIDVIRLQAEQGVDYITIHAGLLKKHIPYAKKRLMGIVSRGGSIMAKWMALHNKENPVYTAFDKILEICAEHDVTLSLGDGMRPGCLKDASDEAQFAELEVLGELVKRSREAGVQAMVEGPGHVPFDEIQMNMEKEIELCDDAPFYILGPVVTDCAPGYDHITSAIGATMGAFHGAAMLCYVTPKEHIGLPNARDVRDGVIAYKIAAHAADVALKRPHARDRDDAISKARVEFDWKQQFDLSMDPDKARAFRAEAIRESQDPSSAAKANDPQPESCDGMTNTDEHFCTMCGEKFCSMRISQEIGDVE